MARLMEAGSHNNGDANGSGAGLLRALSNRNFRIYFFGQLISLTGTWSQMLAISWLVWRLTESALWLGLASFAMQLPILIFGLPGGAFADRYDRLSSFRILETICMLQAIVLAWLTLTGRIELWHVMALSGGIGIVYAFEFPVRQALVMDLAGKHDLLNAISLAAAGFHTSRMLGPMIAGFIVATMGEGACFLINAATFLFLIAALFMIDRKKMLKVPSQTKPILHSIMEGLRHLWKAPHLKFALLITGLMAGIGLQYTTLMPIFADEVFLGGARQLGWLMGASGLGSLVGSLWLARRPTSEGLLPLAATSAVVFSIALIAFSQTTHVYLAYAIMASLGFCLALVFSSMGTFLQHEAPNELRGRVMSLYTTTFMGFSPFGSLIAGAMARAIGAPLTLAIGGLFCLIVGGFLLIKIRRWNDTAAEAQ